MQALIRKGLVIVAVLATLLTAAPAGAGDIDTVTDQLAAWAETDWAQVAPVASADVQPAPVDHQAMAQQLAADLGVAWPIQPPAPAGELGAAAVTTHVVTTDLDIVNGADAVLSLREAVDAANADGVDSIIELTPGVQYQLTNCGPDPAEEDLNVDGDLDHTEANALTITGGVGLTTLAGITDIAIVVTNCQERVIHTLSAGQLTLDGLVIADGDAPLGHGGGVAATGSVVAQRSLFVSSSAAGTGGAILTLGDAVLEDSYVIGNHAGVFGGGITAAGMVQMTNVTASVNTSPLAAAIVGVGDVVIDFSTVAHNTTTTVGAPDIAVGGNFRSKGSLLGLSQGPALACNVVGSTTSGGYNFATDLSCGLGGSTDTESLAVDPDVQFAGVVIPNVGSPLHNAVPPADCSVSNDGLGTSRPQGANCEIGALELRLPSVPKIEASTDALTAVTVPDVLVDMEDLFALADVSTLAVKTAPSNGTAELTGQELVYTPGPDRDGLDQFELQICDSLSIDCATIDVAITTDGLQSKWFFTNVLQSGVATAETIFGKGAGDQFYVGDFDGNGIDDLAKRAQNTNAFDIMNLDGIATAATTTIGYGQPGDEVFVGDWDGNGTDTFAVRRGNEFFVKNTVTAGPADIVIGYGKAGDEVFVGDWDNNGTDTFAVRRGNVFFARNSVTSGNADEVFGYGKAADHVLVGDWDANGTDTFAVRRGNEVFIRNDFATAPAE
ncbi:MAG: hypothetical protein OEU32_12125, partial [Acidimicrobiia bacterium]|nr:hypothetical protein [Acidimicrobiia bacterium]